MCIDVWCCMCRCRQLFSVCSKHWRNCSETREAAAGSSPGAKLQGAPRVDGEKHYLKTNGKRFNMKYHRNLFCILAAALNMRFITWVLGPGGGEEWRRLDAACRSYAIVSKTDWRPLSQNTACAIAAAVFCDPFPCHCHTRCRDSVTV